MSTVYVSAKLAKLIGTDRLIPKEKAESTDRMLNWNATLFYTDRKKCVILTNKATLYSVVRLDILKKDLSNLSEFFQSSLLSQIRADGLENNSISKRWIESFGSLQFAKTDNDKGVIGTLNDLIYQLEIGLIYSSLLQNNRNDNAAGKYLNSIPMGLIKMKNPIDLIHELSNNA